MSKQEIVRRGLGASEIAAVCGLNPYASPWDVWLAHTGQSTFEGNDRTEWGHRLEPAIRQKYADITGRTVEVPSKSMFHPCLEWMRATPDGIVYGVERQMLRLFQAKNSGEWAAKGHWEDAPPEHVQLQEQWEMGVTGAPVADVCVLIGGWDWRMFSVERDDAMIADLIDIGDRFMRDTAEGRTPATDHSDACKRHLASKLRKTQIEWHADRSAESTISEWKRLHREMISLASAKATVENRVRQLFIDAGADAINWSGGRLKVRQGYEKRETDYEHVARLVASAAGMSSDEFAALVEAATKKTPVEPTVSAPKSWRKE